MLFSFLLLALLVNCASCLTGPNVCNDTQPLMHYKMEPYPEPRQVNTMRWSWVPPFRKMKTKYEFDIKYKQVLHKEEVVVSVCCPGYRQVEMECDPVCSSPCIQGECVAPDQCMCYPGFFGETCYVPCQNSRYGQDCQFECQCSNHSTCDVETGECSCADGWEGELCDQKCPEGYHGRECLQQCSCHGHGQCHHVHGQCDCFPGWMGPQCSIRCPYPLFGPYCVSKCDCVYDNAHSCHQTSGKCNCKSRWIGNFCEISTAPRESNYTTFQVVQPLPPPYLAISSIPDDLRLSTLLWVAGPFFLLIFIGVAIFLLRKRFWGYSIESQPLEEYVTYNPSSGSVVFSINHTNGSINNPSYNPSAHPVSITDDPPAYENSMRDSTLTLDYNSNVPTKCSPTRRVLPSPPDTYSISSRSTSNYEEAKY